MQGVDQLFSLQITLLDNLKSIVSSETVPLLLLLKVVEREFQKTLEVRLTNCMDIYFEGRLDEDQLLKYKQEINFQGTWTAYIKLIKASLTGKDKGKVDVVHIDDSILTLKLTYEIEDQQQVFSIKGIGKFDFLDKAKRIQKMMFEVIGIYEQKEKALEDKIQAVSREAIKRSLPEDAAERCSIEDKRKKYKGNLINPNVKKKRQPMGARICAEE